MSDFWSEELITDYLDDRLSQPERASVESHLNDHPVDAETLEEFQRIRDAIGCAKTYSLDDGFSDRVTQAISRQAATQTAKPMTVKPLIAQPVVINQSIESSIKSKSRSSVSASSLTTRFGWRSVVVACSALAATLLLAVFLIPRQQVTDGIAKAEPVESLDLVSGGVNDDMLPSPKNNAGSLDEQREKKYSRQVTDEPAGSIEDDAPAKEMAQAPGENLDNVGLAENADTETRSADQPGSLPSMAGTADQSETIRLPDTDSVVADNSDSEQPFDGEPKPAPDNNTDDPFDLDSSQSLEYEVVILEAAPSIENEAAIDSLKSRIQPRNSHPATRDTKGVLHKKATVINELENKPLQPGRSNYPGRSNSRQRKTNDIVIEQSNANLGKDTVAFEIEATAEQFQEILSRFRGREIEIDESGKQRLITKVTERRDTEIDPRVDPRISGSDQRRDRTGIPEPESLDERPDAGMETTTDKDAESVEDQQTNRPSDEDDFNGAGLMRPGDRLKPGGGIDNNDKAGSIEEIAEKKDRQSKGQDFMEREAPPMPNSNRSRSERKNKRQQSPSQRRENRKSTREKRSDSFNIEPGQNDDQIENGDSVENDSRSRRRYMLVIRLRTPSDETQLAAPDDASQPDK